MDEVPESAKNYRDHASTEAFFHRLGEGCGLGLLSLMALLGLSFCFKPLARMHGSFQAFETPDGLRICSPQLPRYCVGYRQDQTDDHRRWKGFGVSNKIPAYDSLLHNLEAGGAQFAPW